MTEQTDVLIVGAGVAGALMAWRLADAGAQVTIVEAGPHVDRGVAVQRLERAPVRVPEAPYEMAPYAESPATIKDTYIRQVGPDPFRSTYLRLVGGTTWHWLGTALRLLPSDLELQSRYGVGADWPLNYADLATWYDAAETELGVSGHADDTFGPPRQKPYPMPGLPAALGDRLVEQIAARWGSRSGYRRRLETRSLSTGGRPVAPARHASRFARCKPSTMRPYICGRQKLPAFASFLILSWCAWMWDLTVASPGY